jgi:hypothetical protein
MKFRTATALLVAAGVALTGTATAEAGKKKTKKVSSTKVLKRAFAASVVGTSIVHLRVRTNAPGIGTFTDDVWMHAGASGFVDRVRELRVDGTYAGLESVHDQPNGLGDPTGAVGRKRDGAGDPISTHQGVSYSDITIGGVIDTALKAARGELDLSKARQVTHPGRAAYEVPIRAAKGTPGNRNPSQVSVTLWIDRAGNAPFAVRWGEGADLWRSADIQAFELLPDDAAHQPLLDFG